MSVRAKFVVNTVSAPRTVTRWNDNSENTQQEAVDITMYPVNSNGSDENKEFFTNTPGGMITLQTVNMDAAKGFIQGKEYYVDFTEAVNE
jgi:hypothetical protein